MLSTAQLQQTYDQAVSDLSERKFDKALQGFQQVLRFDPDHLDATFQAGRILISADRAGRAIAMLRKAAEKRPNAAKIFQLWAEAVALAGLPEDEQAFLKALGRANLEPTQRIALQDRFGRTRFESKPVTGGVPGKVLASLLSMITSNRFAEAEQNAAAILRANPGSALVANILASAQSAQKNHAAAQANFIRATKTDPNYTEAWENFGRMLLEMEKPTEAVGILRKAVILSPYRLSALILLGEALTRANEPKAAQVLLERAVAVDPRSVSAQIALGNSHARQNHHDDAVAAFSRAEELAGDAAPREMLTALGVALSRVGRDDEALGRLNAILAAMPDNPVALAGKANILQTQGDFDEAMKLFRLATRINPTDGDSYRQLITSYKVSADDPIVDEMIANFQNAPLSDNARMNMAFAIAKALEDQKRDDLVFKYLDQANSLARRQQPYAIRKRLREVVAFKEAFGDFDYHVARVEGATDFAPIFVTGMPRSGTTLVEQIISSHSTVGGAGELSKINTLAVDILKGDRQFRHIGALSSGELVAMGRDYESYVRSRFPDDPRVTDKAINTYMYIGLVRLALPNARFVVVRRDPRDNLFSIYKNKFPDGTHPYAYSQTDLAEYYGTFVEMIDFWRERVPDWFYEVQYEDLVANPEEETRKLIAACGLEWEDACLNFHENKRKVQTLSVYQVRQPITKSSVKGWKRFEKDLKPMLDELKARGLVPE